MKGVQSGHPSGPGKPGLGSGTLWKSLGICGLGFVLCLLLRFPLKTVGWDIPSEIATHAGIGFLVAGILIWTLEFNAKRLLHREVREYIDVVAEDVYKALLERLVPEEIFNEIDDILRTDVIRRDCEYIITFTKPYPGMLPGYFVIRRDLTFKVENQLNRSTTFWARSIYSGAERPDSAAWRGRRFHSRLEVNGKEVVIEEGKNLVIRNGLTVLEHPVHLPPLGSAEILLQGEEPCPVAASRNSYIQGTPVIGLKVTVRNGHEDLIRDPFVQMNHPAREQVKYAPVLGRYVLDRAFFPGQGFEVGWQTAETSGLAEELSGESVQDAER
jgi:hypothetical protein